MKVPMVTHRNAQREEGEREIENDFLVVCEANREALGMTTLHLLPDSGQERQSCEDSHRHPFPGL